MRTATPNDVYTQQGAKPACQEDTNAKFSHLLFRHSYPEHSLHTASCQTRMPRRQQRKNFAPPIGTATPNTVYTQQAAKPACHEDTNAKFSHLLLAQLPRTQFTHTKAPNPNARKTSPQYASPIEAGLPPTTFTHSKLIYTQQAPKPFLEAPNTAPATQTGAADQRRPGAPQPFLETLSTAPATHTGPAHQRRPGAP